MNVLTLFTTKKRPFLQFDKLNHIQRPEYSRKRLLVFLNFFVEVFFVVTD